MDGSFLTIDYIRLAVENIARQYGVKRVYLFGSYAKNNETAKSDIDVLIEKGKPMSLLDLSGMRIKLEDELKVSIDLLTTDGTEGEFRKEISETEVLLYEE